MTVRFASAFVCGLVPLLSLQASAQVLFPEGALQPLPTDGSVRTVALPPITPMVVIATSALADGGKEHVIVWEPGLASRNWLYRQTRLTFFFLPTGGTIELSVVDDEVTARGQNVQFLVWPEPLENWSLTDLGSPGGGGTRLFNLSVSTGSGCPSTVSNRWLQLRGGRLMELLRTGGTGEGGGDELWFSGSIAVWPGVWPGAEEDAQTKRLASMFDPIADVPERKRVVVYDVDIQASVPCRVSRTLYRSTGGGLQRIRTEQPARPVVTPSCASVVGADTQ